MVRTQVNIGKEAFPSGGNNVKCSVKTSHPRKTNRPQDSAIQRLLGTLTRAVSKGWREGFKNWRELERKLEKNCIV